MLAGSNNAQANVDILKSLYERTHNYYLAILSGIVALAGGIVGSFVALLSQREVPSDLITGSTTMALVVVLIMGAILVNRLNRLQRDYLDVIQIYNLLARYFRIYA